MRLSISVTNFSWPGPPTQLAARLNELAARADDSELDTLWVPDHPLQSDPSSALDEPMLDAYTTLGQLAARTSRIRLGTLVSCASFRPPALLVKAVTTLDVLSGGRAWLGVGAGYNADEAAAVGIDFPERSERYDRLADTLELAQRMWAGDDSTFEGRTATFANPIGVPRPVRRPPILVGGTGQRRTLRLVARYADACNLYDIPDAGATLERLLVVLGEHCADLGRPYEEIERTVTTFLAPGESADELTARCAQLAGYGLQHAVVIVRGRPWSAAEVDVLAATAERVKAIG
jgi:F420-dependent oxidoreductase-like protein